MMIETLQRIILSLLLISNYTSAATYLNFTRLIITESEPEATFTVKNEGDHAVLMQLWTDRDNILNKPEQIKTPFLVHPPVFRLNAKDARTVRLQVVGDHHLLPLDKEALFWLNALEVPPKPTLADSDNTLQVAFRTRIKIFYRPKALAELAVENEVKKISPKTTRCGKQICIKLQNPSPLHFTLLNVVLDNDKIIRNLPDDGMILPHSSLTLPLAESRSESVRIKSFAWVDDYGVKNVRILKNNEHTELNR